MVSTIGSTTSTTDTSSVTTAAANSTLEQDEFLQILIAEMKNQDPTEPMGNAEFASQVTQYSSLQQLMDMNGKLDTLIASFDSQTAAAAAGLIGSEVTVSGSTLNVGGSTCDISYFLSDDASEGSINIYNTDGDLVDTLALGAQSSGLNSVTWDCGGSASGTYTVEISASASDGSSVTATTLTSGKVTEVSVKGGVCYLTVNGQELTFSDIVSIKGADV